MQIYPQESEEMEEEDFDEEEDEDQEGEEIDEEGMPGEGAGDEDDENDVVIIGELLLRVVWLITFNIEWCQCKQINCISAQYK